MSYTKGTGVCRRNLDGRLYMASNDLLKKLISAHYDNDQAKFRSAVLQIAAAESSAGHANAAEALKDLVVKGTANSSVYKIKLPDSLCSVIIPSNKEMELVVSDDISGRLARILKEYRMREKLRSNGLKNRTKILLEGKPGTGKTLTASVIAGELQLPLYLIQMDKLITKFMGETSSKLRTIFEQIYNERGVYLFDEFDAIGADRSFDNEVGEMRRVLNTFLKFLEEDESDSLILAATNNKKMLDKALFRRFDDVLHYSLPDENQIAKLFEIKLSSYYRPVYINNSVLKQASGLSHAEITRVCEDCLKELVLGGSELNSVMIVNYINERLKSYEIKGA